ncbi:MAG: hypothetical protein RL685_2797 [Pseudomonadota bacterium]
MSLYAQIAQRLRAQIQSGQLAPGARIPSEHELAEQYDVGRPTVRQATELLVNEGLLERRRGAGTFVRHVPPEVDVFSAFGTLVPLAQSGLPLQVKLISKAHRVRLGADARGPKPDRWAPAGRDAYSVVRLCSLSGTPVLLEEMYFESSAFPGLDRFQLGGRSLSELARRHYMLQPLEAEQRFSMMALDAKRAKQLQLPAGSEVLKVERCIDFAQAPRAHYAELFCRTDLVSFTQHLNFEAAPKLARNTHP